jgi:hypothetical protein
VKRKETFQITQDIIFLNTWQCARLHKEEAPALFRQALRKDREILLFYNIISV